jgi:alpha-N-arabinofuranosidase
MKYANHHQPCVCLLVLAVLSGVPLSAQNPGAQQATIDYLNQAQTQAQAWIQQEGADGMTVWNGPTIGGFAVPKTYVNPILPGHHPAPSLCRVDRTYFLVAGSGNWYPGLPVYRSQDLVNWESLGHVLVRPSQRFIHEQADVWQGSESPTLRFHEGRFYVIGTARLGRSFTANFYVTATNPAGPWSDPVWLDGTGIHPSLFFDSDGHAWVVTRDTTPRKASIVIQELDLSRQVLVGPVIPLVSDGDGGQHLFRLEHRYLLLVADTSHGLRSYYADSLLGPYRPGQERPVPDPTSAEVKPVAHIGRLDMVQTHHGEWWGVYAAERQATGVFGLGRETFLGPLSWDEDRLVLDVPGENVLSLQPRPNLGWHVAEKEGTREEFSRGRLHPRWNQYRTPTESWWSCQERTGWLRIRLGSAAPTEPIHNRLIARRLDRTQFYAATRMDFQPATAGESAGLIVFLDYDAQLRLCVERTEAGSHVTLWQVKQGVETRLARIPRQARVTQLALDCRGQTARFWAGSEESLQPVGAPVTRPLGDLSRQPIGTYIGVFATHAGQPSKTVADFDWFEYRSLP